MSILNDMALFVAVVEAQSFTKASEYLGISLSSLSRRVIALEKEVGIKLLNRTTRSMALTEAGRIYYERCAYLVSEAKIAHENVQSVFQKPQGHIRVSMTSEFGIYYIAPYLLEFSHLYPDISLDIDMTPKRVSLVAEHYDVAFRLAPLEESGLIAQRIGSLSRGLYASPDYFVQQSKNKPNHPKDLSKLNCITMGISDQMTTWTFAQENTVQKVSVSGTICTNNMRMNCELAANGLGVALLDHVIAASDLRAGRLIDILPHWTTPLLPVYAITTSRLLPAKTQAFIRFFAQKLQPA